jgi:hypothetical protein
LDALLSKKRRTQSVLTRNYLFIDFARRRMRPMSRGWESKSVEEQQNQAAAPKPVVANDNAEAAESKRKRQALELQRERILSERTSSPHRRSALSLALADIEERLAELGWTIHL